MPVFLEKTWSTPAVMMIFGASIVAGGAIGRSRAEKGLDRIAGILF